MGLAEPRLRRDLVISQQDGAVVLKDPRTGRFFRFGEVEHFVLSQLDGVSTLAEVRERAGARFGEPPAPEVLEGFVDGLRLRPAAIYRLRPPSGPAEAPLHPDGPANPEQKTLGRPCGAFGGGRGG